MAHKSTPRPDRSAGGRRWTGEEDRLLLELVKADREWVDIAKAMRRSYVSVQNRFRLLNSGLVPDATIARPRRTRRENPDSALNLWCGALSPAGRLVVRELETAVERSAAEHSWRDLMVFSDELRFVMGAVVREVLLCHFAGKDRWLRVTISRVSTHDAGVPRETFRRLITSLEDCAFLERYVGYLGALKLDAAGARKGRLVWVRASRQLIKLCGGEGIRPANLSSHFPSLGN